MRQAQLKAELPTFLGTAKSILRGSWNRKGMKSLYDSDKWEFSWWNRSTERTWKNTRATQYRTRP